jgi:AraC-like DNA-binding protein/mannose-6-phosphate isomerase-like protein (cupin superfamily)
MSKFPYEIMRDRHDALERLDLKFHWGYYEIRVLRFHLTSFARGKIIGFHKHSEFEFHFIPRGRGKVILVDEEHFLHEGLLYLTGPDVMHYQEASENEAMDELCLHIDIVDRSEHLDLTGIIGDWEVAEAKDCIEKLHRLPLNPVMDIYHAMPCFLEAYKACNDIYSGAFTIIKQSIIQILLRTVRAYDIGKTPLELPSRDMKAYRYQLALEYIQVNCSAPLTLEDVSEKLNISSRQLQRIFKEMNEERTFSSIVEDFRMERVCVRLAESQLPIEQIARLEGFSNGNYLHTVFRKRFKMTPNAYRKILN